MGGGVDQLAAFFNPADQAKILICPLPLWPWPKLGIAKFQISRGKNIGDILVKGRTLFVYIAE